MAAELGVCVRRCRGSDGEDDGNSSNAMSQQDIKCFVWHATSFVERLLHPQKFENEIASCCCDLMLKIFLNTCKSRANGSQQCESQHY